VNAAMRQIEMRARTPSARTLPPVSTFEQAAYTKSKPASHRGLLSPSTCTTTSTRHRHRSSGCARLNGIAFEALGTQLGVIGS